MKRCPFCAEEIQEAAIKCRYCGSELNATPSTEALPRSAAGTADGTFNGIEKTYFSDGPITITNTRAILGDKTYAMANVTSVNLGVEPGGLGCAVIERR